jgi:cytochrome c oxidase cbb3-type subunit 3
MRQRSLVEFAVVVLLYVGGGDLECRRPMTKTQRRGEDIYGRMCSVCHGSVGQGYAADRAPALAHQDFLVSATDDFLKSAIADGRRGSTMSAWSVARGGPLAPADIDAMVAFIRTWQDRPSVVLDERPVTGDSERGSVIFERECAGCHGLRGVGGREMHIGNPEFVASASDGFLRYAIRRGRPGTAMPGFERARDGLDGQGIEDVVAYMRSWQSGSVPPLQPPVPAKIPLGPVPLHPRGREPVGFRAFPDLTPVDVVKSELDHGARMGVLDARAPSDYLANHIAGAVSVPFYDSDPYISHLPKSAWLVCYCACPHAESGQLAHKLMTSGFTKVTVLDEGFIVWQTRKYPTRQGMDP